VVAIVGLLISQTALLRAQPDMQIQPGPLIELRAGPPGPPTRVRAPRSSPPRQPGIGVTSATFSVTYNGFSPQAQAAFQAAVDIWANQISSAVPIRITANWTALGPGVLGSAGANMIARNFGGAPVSNTYYPIALANKLAGTDFDPTGDDIIANFSSAFPNWYYGTDGNAPAGTYDLETVVLHEIGHGLGFFGSATYTSGSGGWGKNGSPYIYDRFVVNGSNQAIIDTNQFANPSTDLGAQYTSNNLFFNGGNAVAAAGQNPKLYEPASWQQGSSYAHLDEATYPAGNQNSLMTPQLGQGESILNPGPIMLAIFQDIGWGSAQAATNTPTNTSTRTPTNTPTGTPTGTPTNTPTGTPTSTPDGTPTATPPWWVGLPLIQS
jgi:hypothetical protein